MKPSGAMAIFCLLGILPNFSLTSAANVDGFPVAAASSPSGSNTGGGKATVAGKEKSEGGDSSFNRVKLKASVNVGNIQTELRSAKSLAAKGAVLYGAGLAMEGIGLIVFYNDVSTWNDRRNSKYYYAGTTTNSPPITGLYIAIGGAAANLGGLIMANIGGSQACSILEESSDGDVSAFYGWRYFIGSFACGLGATLGTAMNIPLFPVCFSILGVSLNIASLVSAVSYTNKAFARSLVTRNIRVSPIFDSRTCAISGAYVSASF